IRVCDPNAGGVLGRGQRHAIPSRRLHGTHTTLNPNLRGRDIREAFQDRYGVMYVLDRITGEFLQGKPFVKVNWMDGFDKDGRPHRVPGKVPVGSGGDGGPIMPTVLGGTNWYPPSFSPKTGLFY